MESSLRGCFFLFIEFEMSSLMWVGIRSGYRNGVFLICIFLRNNIFIVKSVCIMELKFENTLGWLSYFFIPLRLLSGELCSTNLMVEVGAKVL
jgi:hypothetical protein